MTDFPTIQVHPVALFGDDVIVRDPDQPDREVVWEIHRRMTRDDVIVVEYRDESGVEGSYGFEDPTQWITVRVRRYRTDVEAAEPVEIRTAA